MKKRLFAGLLVLVLLLMTGCAKKEPFPFRDGITFGMSADEVIAIEGEPDREYEYTDGKFSLELTYYNRVVAGGEAMVEYLFSKSGEMMVCRIWFAGEGQSYDDLEESLTKLYGKPAGDAGDAGDVIEALQAIRDFEVNPTTDEEIEAAKMVFDKSSKRVKNNGTVLHFVFGGQSMVVYYDASYITPQGKGASETTTSTQGL